FTVSAALIGMLVASAQTPPEPGATPGVVLTNISKNTAKFASVFPQVAVSRSNPNLVAVAWRQYNLPIDTNALKEYRVAECHVSMSKDGGVNYTDRNMMSVLRTTGGNGEPLLWGCNAPWVALASDNTMYFGGALFTAGGVIQVEPKAGRAGVSVSTDGGTSWSKMVPGIMLNRLAPGMRGLNGGMNQEDTPWDGANGIVDPITGTFYSTAGAYISASEDKGKTFGIVYEGRGTTSAAFGTIVASRNFATREGEKCPCLLMSISTDKGKTWTESLIARAHAWNPGGTVRYPVSAASPAKPGHYAVAVYQPDHRSVKVYYTIDGTKTWKMATPKPTPANVPINNVSQLGVGYTTDGKILVTWRGFRNPGAFNTFVAMLDGDTFGPTIKVSPELSIYPPLTYAGNYGNGNGGGDFTTWVTGNTTAAFVAFPFAPRGEVLDTYVAKIPLSILR
ncbi:MAG: exo-alpha-sialidase, partial [Acidobacteria bacterium]|nr:exo-alpha-sialidase [Acidobacteriota bacterium]